MPNKFAALMCNTYVSIKQCLQIALQKLLHIKAKDKDLERCSLNFVLLLRIGEKKSFSNTVKLYLVKSAVH